MFMGWRRIPGFDLLAVTWEFPKIGGTLFSGPYNKDPIISGTKLGSSIFGNSHIVFFGGW